MTYAPTTWVDETGVGDGTILTAARLNNLETGIVGAGISEGAVQPGVLTATDCAPAVGVTGSRVDLPAGVVYVRSAAGVLVRTTPAATSITGISQTSAPGKYRLDQVVVDTAGVMSRLVGTEGTTVTINNRTGFAAIPAGKQLIYDFLANGDGVGPTVRDRRPWARGAQMRYLSTSDTLTGIGTGGAELTVSRLRMECAAGNPILAVARGLGAQTSGFAGRVGVWVDGVLHPSANGGGCPYTASTGTNVALNATFLLETIAAGSHLFSLAYYNGSGTGSFSVTGGANDPISLILREHVAGVANNGTS